MRVSDALKGSLPPNESEILLARILGWERSKLFAYPERELSADEERQFQACASRREKGEPIAYILGEREFFGQPFRVNASVLIPRPSTEALVEEAIEFLKNPRDHVRDIEPSVVAWSRRLRDTPAQCIVDVGTGSGVVACTLARETAANVIATDISEAAADVARRNVQEHGLADRVDVRTGSLLDPVQTLRESFLLVSNPPYVPTSFALSGDTLFEPEQALFAGEDGGDIVRQLVRQATAHPSCIGWVIECRPEHVTS